MSLRLVTYRRLFLRPRSRIPAPLVRDYEWERDFPVALRSRARGSKESSFTLEFELTPEEIRQFRDDIGSQLNGTLPILVSIGQSSADLRISKQGRGAAVLNARIELILQFIRERLAYTYIPSVRTADQSTRVVEQILAEELSVVENDPEYHEALQAVSRLQEPVLLQVSEAIQSTLQEFLPGVESARVVIADERRHAALRHAVSVLVSDGDETDLRQKGDGVQSLAAIAMMRFASQRRAGSRHIVLSVEEPESHLHPAAVQQVRRVLQEISERHQVVITTHSPELVDRINVRSNILVAGKRAKPARTLGGVRSALGVQPSHNLQHAELMVLVEGPSDVTAVRSLTVHGSSRLRNALEAGLLVFSSLDGVGNLSHVARLLNASVQPLHCLIDNDGPARTAYRSACEKGILLQREANFVSCPGQIDSELEDLIRVDLYKGIIEAEFGVSLDHPSFRTAQKWSERIRSSFLAQGRAWNDQICCRIKQIIAGLVEEHPANALIPERRESFDAFLTTLGSRLSSLRS